MYKFSAPMPYTKEDIQKLLDINNQIEKSKITNLYFGLPSHCSMFTGFEQARNINSDKTDFNFWENLMRYSLDKGFELIYLLNNPKPLDLANPKFSEQIEKLKLLLTKLEEIGVTKIRAAAPQLLSYLGKYYSHFDIYASTSLDYKTLAEYQNFIMVHPEVKQIVPSHDVNKNFKLLKNIQKDYPDIEIEIMVNEGCWKGCPHRSLHEIVDIDKSIIYNKELSLSNNYSNIICRYISEKYPFHGLTLNNNIYPWEIEEYFKIGINKFKLVGRDLLNEYPKICINAYYNYLKTIDDYKFAENQKIVNYIHHLMMGDYELQYLLTKDIRNLLPDIKYFKKYGHLCASGCGVECRYCYKCAEKIEKVYKKKIHELEKKSYYVPACTMAQT